MWMGIDRGVIAKLERRIFWVSLRGGASIHENCFYLRNARGGLFDGKVAGGMLKR
jgi:hypothetical protein